MRATALDDRRIELREGDVLDADSLRGMSADAEVA
jgi:hypothetical protein